MKLAKVMGEAVATIKHSAYQGRKVLVVQPIDPNGEEAGKSFLAVDTVQAGVGEKVLVAREGNAARQACGDDNAPIHSVILGIVDEIETSS